MVDTSFLTPDQVSTLVSNGTISQETGDQLNAKNGNTQGFPDAVSAATQAGITPAPSTPTNNSTNTTGVPAAALSGLSPEQTAALQGNGMQVPDTTGNNLGSTTPVVNDSTGKPQSQTQAQAATASLRAAVSPTPTTPATTSAPATMPASIAPKPSQGSGSANTPGEKEELAAIDANKKSNNASFESTKAANERNTYQDSAAADIQAHTIAMGSLQDQLAENAMKANDQIAKNHQEQRARDREEEMKNIKDVDPNHFWKERGTALTIAGAISEGLGSLGQGLQIAGGFHPGENQAVNIINNAIGRDIDSQKDNINSQFKKLAVHQGIDDNQENRDRYAHAQSLEARASALGRVQMDLRSQAATLTSAKAKDNATILNNQLQDEKSKIDLELQGMRTHLLNAGVARQAAAGAQAYARQEAMRKEISTKATAYQTDSKGQLTPQQAMNRAYQDVTGVVDPKLDVGTGWAPAKQDKNADANADIEKSISIFSAASDKAMKAGTSAGAAGAASGLAGPFGNIAMQHLAPAAAAQLQDLDYYNHTALPALMRLLGDRVPPDTIKEQSKNLQYNAWDSPEIKAQKKQEAIDFVRSGLGIKGKGSSADVNVNLEK